MPIEFDNYRLPKDVEVGASWRQSTMTHRVRGFGGTEIRYSKQRVLWRASLNVLPLDAGHMIKAFYRQIGPKYAFLAECNAHRSTEDLPDLDTVLVKRELDDVWPLAINYGDETRPAIRRIVAPVLDDLESPFSVFKDGVLVNPANYTVLAGGLVKPITTPDQGWDAAIIDWSGNFDVPVTLDADENAVNVLYNCREADGSFNMIRTVNVNIAEVPFDLSDV